QGMPEDWCSWYFGHGWPSAAVLVAGKIHCGKSVCAASRSPASGAEKEMSKPLDQPKPYDGSSTTPEPLDVRSYGRALLKRLFDRPSELERPRNISQAPQRPRFTSNI